jgi:plasmid stabilization system protein ParE
MARVTRRPQAEADILEIWDYVAEDSIAEADRWLDRLDEKLALWATQPMMSALATSWRQEFGLFRCGGRSGKDACR